MSLTILAYALILSVLGTGLATIIALFPGRRSHRLSNALLAVSGVVGAVVGTALAIGPDASLALPQALYAATTDGNTPSWLVFYDMVFGLDRFSAIFFTLISIVSAMVAIYAIPYLEHYATTYNMKYVNALTALFVLGMQGVVLSTNIIGFMTFWEVMSIASFFLVLADGTQASRRAGFLYLFMTHLGAAAIMAGLFLLSGGALLSDFSVLALITPQLPPATVSIALALLLFGFGSKAGLVPFHVWLPEAHPQAPAPVSALMSGVMLKVAVYGLLRVLLFMIPGVPMWFIGVTLTCGALSAILGVLYAVLERDLKRLLAYSSIENLGVIFIMIGLGLLAGREGSAELAQAALYAALLLVMAHALFKSGLFLASGTIIEAVHTPRLEAMGGLAKRMPQFSVVVCVLALSAAAMPPFGSFVAEWTLLQAIVGGLAGATSTLKIVLVIMLPVIAFTTGLALFAMVKMYAIAFLAKPRSEMAEQAHEPVPALSYPSVTLAFLGLLLGVFAPFVLNRLGAISIAPVAANTQLLVVGGGVLAPVTLFIIAGGIILVLLVLRRLLSDIAFERSYQTWDCGQPITPRMEYTATALSAPIRFFFRFLLQSQKVITVTPLTPNNPWIASRVLTLTDNEVWYHRVYTPLSTLLTRIAAWIGRLQNGSIQFYISLILLALLVTLIIAL